MNRLNLVSLKLNQAIMIFKELKNPLSSFLFYRGSKDKINVKTKKLGSFNFDHTQRKLFNSLLLTLPYLKESDKLECKSFYEQCLSNNHIIELNDYNVVNKEAFIFSEKFAENPYNFKNINKDDIIIDIGANVGDTALYFANQGLIVYAFEPIKKFYEIALENVKINPDFKNRINIFNFAVSNNRGSITIDSMHSVSSYVNEIDCYDVEVITLEDIIFNYDIKPKFLKIDCEGCEFEIIKNTDLSIFDEIILEHHASFKNEDYTILTDTLEKQGFKIDLIPLWSFKIEDYGIIHAYK